MVMSKLVMVLLLLSLLSSFAVAQNYDGMVETVKKVVEDRDKENGTITETTTTTIEVEQEPIVIDDDLNEYETFNYEYWGNETEKTKAEMLNKTVVVEQVEVQPEPTPFCDVDDSSVCIERTMLDRVRTYGDEIEKNWIQYRQNNPLFWYYVVAGALTALVFWLFIVIIKSARKIKNMSPEDYAKILLDKGYDDSYVEKVYWKMKQSGRG